MVDSQKTLICPACQKEMVKVFLKNECINIDLCLNGCGGIYFDNKEVSLVDDQDENIDEIIEILKNKIFEKTDQTAVRICPSCKTKMVKHFVSPEHKIEIDDCYSCGGKFFDNNELLKMRSLYDSKKDKDNATRAFIYSIMGDENIKLQIDSLKMESNRSFLRKLFDKYIFS